ncbi:uncharacterized protein LOC113168114 [Anabas testudineus]|uniref:uncharacterized protein LOC113168114 n=1 Tax=Anabas testudineus TaxID=64144 RepID=UPI000E45DF87|nr:uncharacterized protein LOC113168114 [Anabas testudineus]
MEQPANNHLHLNYVVNNSSTSLKSFNHRIKDILRNGASKRSKLTYGEEEKTDSRFINNSKFTYFEKNLFGVNIDEDQELDKSVCKVFGPNISQGTGFVFFSNFIMTNAHLFENYIQGDYLNSDVHGFAQFSNEPEQTYRFTVKVFDIKCDFALLELNLDRLSKIFDLPPGLLKKTSPPPLHGSGCKISGYPGGDEKKMESTEIIEKQKREQAVYDLLFIGKNRSSQIMRIMKEQGFANVLLGRNEGDKVVAYKTRMGPGSSGSPVFNDQGVFGMHRGGHWYRSEAAAECSIVLGFAYPLYVIFGRLVILLKESRSYELLNKIKEEVKGNSYLEEILRAETADDSDEPMEINLDQTNKQPINIQGFQFPFQDYRFTEQLQIELN